MIAAFGVTIATVSPLMLAALGCLAAYIKYLTKKQNKNIEDIHILVNSRLTEALARVTSLEEKLQLAPGEAIPTQQTVTPESESE